MEDSHTAAVQCDPHVVVPADPHTAVPDDPHTAVPDARRDVAR
ncbi:hypothetical protein [Plantactinospora endophytica]|nr:hypothetical protein [Plantactinospora endophytica]